MSAALKPKNTSCYTSARVFEGVRKKSGDEADKHVARVKRALAAMKPKKNAS